MSSLVIQICGVCVHVCVCFPLLISGFLTCDCDLTGRSEGSNERVAIQVVTKGMKHRLLWCFLLVVAAVFYRVFVFFNMEILVLGWWWC